MTDRLSDQVPEFDPVQEGVNIAGMAGLELLPGIGGALSTIVGGALSSQAEQRNLRLFAMITNVVDDLASKVDGLTVEGVVQNPRFLAAAEKVIRAAQETSDEEHRARLIGALRHAGPWSKQEKYSAERMTDLLTRIGPLHMFLLRFFADPAAWLAEHNDLWTRGTESMIGGNLLGVLRKYVFPNDEVPAGEIERVVAVLERESFMNQGWDLLHPQMSGGGLVEPRLTDFGRAFLAFAEGELEP